MPKILEVQTEHTHPFKTIIEVLKDMLPEVNIEFIDNNPKKSADADTDKNSGDTENNSQENQENQENQDHLPNDQAQKDNGGMRILAVDTSKNVLINMRLDKKNFTKFACKKKKITLGVNLAYFHKLIKSMDKDDNMSLNVEDDDINHLRININNTSKNKKDEYKLKLLDLDKNEMTIPVISFDVVVQMNATEFHKVCREMSQIADFVEIRCTSNKIQFSCKGDYAERTTTYEVNNNGGDDNVSIKHSGSTDAQIIQGIYELKHLVLFGKCSSLCGEIQIYMKNKFPLVIRYQLPKLGRILLCLTPLKDNDNIAIDYSDEENYYSDDDKCEYINQ